MSGVVTVPCDWRLFHRRASTTGNALSPTVDRECVERPETLMRQNAVNAVVDYLEYLRGSSHR